MESAVPAPFFVYEEFSYYKEFDMGYWDNNRKYVRNELRQTIEGISKVENCWLQYTEEGQGVLVVERDGQGYLLNRLHSPDCYAKEIVSEIVDFDEYATIFLFGISDGRIADELRKKMKDSNHLVIYEPSVYVLKLALENFDLSGLLEDSRVFLVDTIENNQMLINVINATVDLYNKDLSQFYCQPNYEILYGKEYKLFMEQIQYQIAMEDIKINTVMQFEEKLVDASMSNLINSVNAKDIVTLKNKLKKEVDFDKIPAIIVSAGPSLDKNVSLLRLAKGRAFILAVDAALRTLSLYGIKPDAFYSVDVEAPSEFFDNVEYNAIPFFITNATRCELVEMHKGIHIITKAPMHIYQKYYQKKKACTLPSLEVSGAVGSDAMLLVRYLGFKNIIYIGQDLAYLGNKTHTKGMRVEETIIGTRNAERILVKGIDGGEVETNLQFDLYRKWMEVRLKNNKDYTVIDATEGGALIRGTKIMTFSNAISEYCKGEMDFEKLLKELPLTFNEQEKSDFREYIYSRNNEIEKLRMRIKKAIEIYPKLIELAEQKLEETEEFAKLYKEIRDVQNIDRDTEFSVELQIYNRKNNFEDTNKVYDKNTTVVELLQHSLKIIKGYNEAIVQLKKDYEEKVISKIYG